jgi:hypothetical protein
MKWVQEQIKHFYSEGFIPGIPKRENEIISHRSVTFYLGQSKEADDEKVP